jgi:DNA primase
MIDTTTLKAIDVKDVWQALGYELRSGHSNARCFSTAHAKGDRNPSLGLDTKANRFKCFACGIQGDTIELVQQARGVDFKEATEWLADTFNAPVSRITDKPAKRYIDRPNSPVKAPTNVQLEPIRNPDYVYSRPEHIAIYEAFINYTDEPNEQLLAWWQGRGLSDDLLKRANWRSITRATWQKLAKDYTPKQLLQAGLLTERPNGLTPLFYNHSVAVPFYDSDGLIYLRARSLDPETKAKYLAPRNTSPPIYNYQTITDYDGTRPLFITESETDSLALNEQGETAVALVGGQKHPDSLVVRELAHLITNGLTPKIQVNIVADRDATGDSFFANVAKALYLAGIPSDNIEKYQSDPEYKDVAEQLRANKATELPNGLPDKNETLND